MKMISIGKRTEREFLSGRGIIVGRSKTEKGSNCLFYYGKKFEQRNRIFVKTGRDSYTGI